MWWQLTADQTLYRLEGSVLLLWKCDWELKSTIKWGRKPSQSHVKIAFWSRPRMICCRLQAVCVCVHSAIPILSIPWSSKFLTAINPENILISNKSYRVIHFNCTTVRIRSPLLGYVKLWAHIAGMQCNFWLRLSVISNLSVNVSCIMTAAFLFSDIALQKDQSDHKNGVNKPLMGNAQHWNSWD